MAPSGEGGKKPKIGSKAETQARKEREADLSRQLAALDKQLTLASEVASEMAKELGLKKQQMPDKVLVLAKDLLGAEEEPVVVPPGADVQKG